MSVIFIVPAGHLTKYLVGHLELVMLKTLSQVDAIEQCQKMDSRSSLFRYTQAELDSVVLHMNNGDPIVSFELVMAQ